MSACYVHHPPPTPKNTGIVERGKVREGASVAARAAQTQWYRGRTP
jgi:hypothetical protein